MKTESINPEMFMLAREARGYSQVELGERSGISRSSITKFEQGDQQLSPEFISALKAQLKFGEDLYSLHAELLPPAVYRRRDNVKVKLLNKIDAMINILALGIGRLLSAIRYDAVAVPSIPASDTITASEIASQLRKAWRVPAGPITNLTHLLEQHGCITLPVDFDTDRVDSRSVLIAGQFPVIFYNKHLQGDRLRFTLSYELGHLVMHSRSQTMIIDDSGEANVFSAAFLLPEKDIRNDLHPGLSVKDLASLKSKWLVSMHALLYRADDIGAISPEHKHKLIGDFNALRIRRREPKELDVPVERGQLLRDLITKYRSMQKMNKAEIAAFFYMQEDEFLEVFN